MFERFTKEARAVVQGAVEHCEGSGASSVEAEHLLLALLDREASRASFALAALGLAPEERKEAGTLSDEGRPLCGVRVCQFRTGGSRL